MIKPINFTDRKPIKSEHVRIQLHRSSDGRFIFDADFNLADLNLPSDAEVFVEAYRQTDLERFPFGMAEDPQSCDESTTLSEFTSSDGLQFRVKVVDRGSPFEAARILALGDRIKPTLTSEDDTRSLLPVDWGDFRDEVWRLDFDESGDLVLRFSRHLMKEYRSVLSSPAFTSLALPVILREVLRWAVRQDDPESLLESECTPGAWLRFALSLPGVLRPRDLDVWHDEDWLTTVIESFFRSSRLNDRFRDFRSPENAT